MLRLITTLIILSCFVQPINAMERFDIVTTETLSAMLKERQRGTIDFLLINTLDRLIYKHHSIPGSINIPFNEFEKSKALLGDDMDRLIITYCMGYR